MTVLSPRALSRAFLARQLLLCRHRLSPLEAIERLGGLQSQAPHAAYVGLWTRLEKFEAFALSSLLERREVVRAPLMRGTIHLVSARECRSLRIHTQSIYERTFAANAHHRNLRGTPVGEILEAARPLFDAKPQTRVQLSAVLKKRWPNADPTALAYAVTFLEPLVQVTPRGLWGQSAQATWTPFAHWLGPEDRPLTLEALILRYLGAFGPATIADFHGWSGLQKTHSASKVPSCSICPNRRAPTKRLTFRCVFCLSSTTRCSATPIARGS